MAEARRVPDVALLGLVQVVFGSLSVAGKYALAAVPPFGLVAVRITAAAALLVLLERLFVRHRVARADWPLLAGLSLLGVVLNQLFFITGLQMTTAVEATVLITTIPVFTLAVGLAWGRETWSHRRGLGMGVAFAGVVVLLGASALEFGSRTFLGNLLVAINSLFYSVYLVASRPVLARIPPLTVTAATFLVGALVVLPLGALDLLHLPALPDSPALLAIAYIVLGPTVLTYFLVSQVLVRVPASTVAAFVYLQPLAAGVLAVLLLHEPVTLRILASAGLIFLGVALVAWVPRRARRFVPAA